MKRAVRMIGVLGLGIGVSLSAAAQQTQTDSLMQRYLDCINSSAKQQQEQGSDKLSNSQTVISACSSEREALLKGFPDARTAKFVAEIERHLKTREKPK